MANGLDHAVFGAACLHGKVSGQVFDALVVDAVDFGVCLVAQQLLQAAAVHHFQGMEMQVVDLGIAVRPRVGTLGGNVLVQGAAKGDVDELQAPANPKHRLAGRHKRVHQSNFVGVTIAVTVPAGV